MPGLLVLTAVAAPLLEATGGALEAGYLYSALSYVCRQLPSRSVWLLGSPMGLDSRSASRYLAFSAAGLWMVRRRQLGSCRAGVLLLVPILVDCSTQLAGWRQSTNLLRVITGSLAGLGLASLTLRVWTSSSRSRGEPYRPIVVLVGCVVAVPFISGYLCLALPLQMAAVAEHGTRHSTLPAPLPEDVRVMPPARDTPPDLAAFSGKWTGKWDGVLDHVLVVERIDSTGVRVIFAHGAAGRLGVNEPRWIRERGRFVEGELRLTGVSPVPHVGRPPGVARYRMRSDSRLEDTLEWEGTVGLDLDLRRRPARIEMTRAPE